MQLTKEMEIKMGILDAIENLRKANEEERKIKEMFNGNILSSSSSNVYDILIKANEEKIRLFQDKGENK